MSPLFNPDGSPFVHVPRWTQRDPQLALYCGGCRFNAEHKCMGTFTQPSGPHAGTYRCTCLRCGGIAYKGESK